MIKKWRIRVSQSSSDKNSRKKIEQPSPQSREIYTVARSDSTPGAIPNKNSWSNSIKLVQKERIFETDQPMKRLRNFRSALDNPFTLYRNLSVSSFGVTLRFILYSIYTFFRIVFVLLPWNYVENTLDSLIKNSFLSIISNRNPYFFFFFYYKRYYRR